MKLYEKPAIDIAVFDNADVITNGSSGGLTGNFTKITNIDSEKNNVNIDSLQ